MNTRITIKIVSNLGTISTYDLINKAFEQFKFVVEKYSRFDNKSELGQLNSNSGVNFKVSDELFSLIQKILEIAKLSKGVFDPTIIDLLEAYGFDKKKDFSILNNEKGLKEKLSKLLKERPNWTEIRLNNTKKTIFLQPKQKLDLGSIGKGYAIDLAAKTLNPAKNYIINAGGDIYAKGKNEKNKYWEIGLSIPKDKTKIFKIVTLKNESLACSGSWASKIKYFHHLLNPKTAKPMQQIDQSFVRSKLSCDADGLASMLYLTGHDGLDILEKQKIGGLILKEDKFYLNIFFDRKL